MTSDEEGCVSCIKLQWSATMQQPRAESLKDVDAFLFDVFGTVVDWQGSVAQQVQEKYYDGILQRGCSPCPMLQLVWRNANVYLLITIVDWIAFAKEWRAGYIANTYVSVQPLLLWYLLA
jgi:hypothetical protein